MSRPNLKMGRTHKILDEAVDEVAKDQNELYDFYHYCVRRWPDLFKRMDITQFKRWNDERISALNRDRPAQTKHQVRREIEANTQDRCVGHWCLVSRQWEIINTCGCDNTRIARPE